MKMRQSCEKITDPPAFLVELALRANERGRLKIGEET